MILSTNIPIKDVDDKKNVEERISNQCNKVIDGTRLMLKY